MVQQNDQFGRSEDPPQLTLYLEQFDLVIFPVENFGGNIPKTKCLTIQGDGN